MKTLTTVFVLLLFIAGTTFSLDVAASKKAPPRKTNVETVVKKCDTVCTCKTTCTNSKVCNHCKNECCSSCKKEKKWSNSVNRVYDLNRRETQNSCGSDSVKKCH